MKYSTLHSTEVSFSTILPTHVRPGFALTQDDGVVHLLSLDSIHAIDMGLPNGILWANMNLGAQTIIDPGKYFAWGETTNKSNYEWESYSHGDGTTFTKYSSSDGIRTLLSEDDAAHTRLGGYWRMPTSDEFSLLFSTTYTSSTWITKYNTDGVHINGIEFTSLSTGNKIFIPAGGSISGSNPSYIGQRCCIWTSTLGSKSNKSLGSMYFGESGPSHTIFGLERYYGLNIRPVYQLQ